MVFRQCPRSESFGICCIRKALVLGSRISFCLFLTFCPISAFSKILFNLEHGTPHHVKKTPF